MSADQSEGRGGGFPWSLVIVLLATAAVYARSLAGELVYDDLDMVARNPAIRSLAGIPELFTQGYWDFLGETNAGYNGYWRPLTATVLTLAHAAGGGNVPVFHAACVLVHVLATWTVWALALRLLRSREGAFFAALLFGLHPVQVESVAWITALNDPLFGLFALLTLLAFLRWRERGSPGVPLLAAACFALSALAKEAAVSILPMLLLLDWLRPGKPAGAPPVPSPVRAYAPLAAVLVGYYFARVAVFGEPTAGLERVTTYFGVGAARLALLRVEILGGGLQILAWPVDLNVFRPFHPSITFAHPALYGATVALAAWFVLLVLAWRRRRRDEALALLLAAATVLPILVRVASLGRFPLSDRYLYVPALGFALYLSQVAPRLLPRLLARGALAGVVVLLALGTWRRIAVWHDEEALFRSALAADERSAYAHWGLGRVLLNQYQGKRDPRVLDEAFRVFERGMDLAQEALDERDDTDVFLSSTDVLQIELGHAWCLIFEAEIDGFHDFDTPIAKLDQTAERIYAIRRDAEGAREAGIQVWGEPLNVASVHVAIGVAHMKAGRSAEAERAFSRAVKENPDYPEAHHDYGRLLMQIGAAERARHHFQRASELRPGEPRDKLWLAKALIETGWIDRAEEIALALHDGYPYEPEAMMVLENVRERRGDWSGALRWLDRVLERAPLHRDAWYRRALVLLQLGETQGAIEAFRRAVELMPDDFHARYNFARTLLSNGAVEAARPHAIAAYALCSDANLYLQLRETLRSMPLDPGQAIELATIDRKRRQSESALEWVDRALAMSPGDGHALLVRGRALLDLERDAEALESLRAACAALPNEYVPHFELGVALARNGWADEALEHLREAGKLGPPAAWTESERAAAVKDLEQRIRKLEDAGPFVGPRPEAE
jgi:tetratricopeptide (TPR) repeat protein